MLKIKSSGAVIGDQRVNNKFISTELQEKLNGKSLAYASKEGLIVAERFENVEVTYHGEAGPQVYDRMELVTNHGNIIVSEALGNELIDWAPRLGDLQFNLFTSNRDNTTVVFRLQKPGGGVSVTRSKVDGFEETADDRSN